MNISPPPPPFIDLPPPLANIIYEYASKLPFFVFLYRIYVFTWVFFVFESLTRVYFCIHQCESCLKIYKLSRDYSTFLIAVKVDSTHLNNDVISIYVEMYWHSTHLNNDVISIYVEMYWHSTHLNNDVISIYVEMY